MKLTALLRTVPKTTFRAGFSRGVLEEFQAVSRFYRVRQTGPEIHSFEVTFDYEAYERYKQEVSNGKLLRRMFFREDKKTTA
jgi:hypothetical protein